MSRVRPLNKRAAVSMSTHLQGSEYIQSLTLAAHFQAKLVMNQISHALPVSP